MADDREQKVQRRSDEGSGQQENGSQTEQTNEPRKRGAQKKSFYNQNDEDKEQLDRQRRAS